MKTLLLVLATLTIAGHAHADARTYGSQCGLLDGYDSDAFENVGEQKSITHEAKYTKLEMEQIVIAAKKLAGELNDKPIATLKDAVEALTQGSEGGEAEIGTQHVNNQDVTVVIYYPGGNPVGAIFAKGTTHALAQIQDSDVVCEAK